MDAFTFADLVTQTMGVDPNDTLALGRKIETLRTIGRGNSGIAY